MIQTADPYVFVVGSPRSGTTILGEILDLHAEINQWYEPNFVWDSHFRLRSDDQRIADDATDEVIAQISGHFSRYRQNTKSRFLVDKSPLNSLKIPFVRQIFPDAKFIHILRDGRDVTLSIHNEWVRRIRTIEGKNSKSGFDYGKASSTISTWLKRQPFLSDRLRALWFETHGHLFDKKKHLNRLRWNGAVGWGPRFKGWEKARSNHTMLQFNVLQWQNCVSSIADSWDDIHPSNKMEIRYENFVQQPLDTLRQVLSFLGCENDPGFENKLPLLKKDNFNKWKSAFSVSQLEEIRPLINPGLTRLGYIKENEPW
jgi:hypothetical protein